MKTKIELINEVLAKWNPLDVPQNIAKDEYLGYVPIIIKNMVNKKQLLDCIEDIIINKMGLEYNSNNNIQKNDLKRLCTKLMTIK
jgi:hypothetical protein